MRRRLPLLTLAVALGVAAPVADAATLSVIHGVPGLRADVYVNGKRSLAGFQAGAMTPAVHLPAGVYRIAVRVAGSPPTSPPALTATIHLRATDDVSVVVHLDPAGRKLITVFPNHAATMAAGTARLVVRHASQSPALDVVVDGRRVLTNLRNDATGTRVLTATTHTVQLFTHVAHEAVAPPQRIGLQPGKEYVLYTIGSERRQTFDQLVQVLSVGSLPPSGIPAGTSGLADPARLAPAAPVAFDAALAAGAVLALLGAGTALRRRRA